MEAEGARVHEQDVNDLRDELIQSRTEQALNHRAAMNALGKMQAAMSTGSPRALKARSAKNDAVKKKNFFAPLYAGAEQQDNFDDMWVALLSSDLVCAMVTRRIVEAIVQAVAKTGRAPNANDEFLVHAAIEAAMESGKGMRAIAFEPRPSPTMNLLDVTAPLVAQLAQATSRQACWSLTQSSTSLPRRTRRSPRYLQKS